MTPRHPPRALRGLTTPTRPPPPTGARGPRPPEDRGRRDVKPPDCAAARGVVRRCGPPHSFDCGSTRRPRQEARLRRLPRVRGEIVSCHYHADSRIRDACVTDDRIVKDAIGADDARPGVSPDRTFLAPPPGRWPGARQPRRLPRPAPSRSAAGTSEAETTSPPRRVQGGRRPIEVAGEEADEWDGRSARPVEPSAGGAGGGGCWGAP